MSIDLLFTVLVTIEGDKMATTWRDLVKIWPPLAHHSILSSDQNYKSAPISQNFERSSGGQFLAINYDCHSY